MPWTPPAGVTPIDRRNPTTNFEADIPAVLDWLKSHYAGNTVKGVVITANDTGNSFRVDSNARPYVLSPVVLGSDFTTQATSLFPQLSQLVGVAQSVGATGMLYGGTNTDGSINLIVPSGIAVSSVPYTLPSGTVISVYQFDISPFNTDTGVY